ncbi:hypothetical protein TsFJ059_002635 [Trichoderma semiorbis]|uniref:Uncharacterized protein n=1 Tax=Trichoderma semiorbis TaxID=1491008 RepID=A0A9P8KT39_9HYPO|nr:hypothetical protein TsFJ059_002635 [Trichoderma semiorbis]
MDPSSGASRPPAADAEHEHELRQHDAEPDLGPERDQQEEEQQQQQHEPEHQTHQQQQHQPHPDRLVAVSPAAVDSAVVARDDAEDKLLTAPDASSDTAPVATHLARFEFSDRGTKILMVEWYPGAAAAPTPSGQDTTNASVDVVSSDKAGPQSHDIHADDALAAPAQHVPVPSSPVVDAAVWEVSWAGKSTFLPARDTDEDDARRRVYFMLPSDVPVPATVTIARPGRPSLILKPLPAIFPEHFQAESGPRGVLHTIWAKKRLRELELEMEAEMRTNAESVGLEMALAEKQWIVENFLRAPQSPTPTTMTPRSPVTGRLGDKLKGLRLATSPADLVPSPAANTFTSPESQSHMLSPLGGDIAVSSFAAISRSRPTGPISLDAALQGNAAPLQQPDGHDAEEDLFALPMSPRSPDMIKSPFSALGGGLGL